MKNLEEKAGLCALGRIFGFEPRIGIALISHAGNARAVFNLPQEELDFLLGPFSKYKGQIDGRAYESATKELGDLSNMGISYCGWTEDEEYPSALKECPDPPIGLYVRSETPCSELWTPQKKIAIVGTRDISSYGSEWCEKTVSALASSGVQPMIVSGLALGTDICAHRAALEHGLPTIGVMATGPDSIYPYRNRQTALHMTRIPGCALITDYPPRTAPLAIHFLRRNRIIAGLSDATILIESRLKGGGMMTSRLAFSYDRDVFALPGRVDDLRSQGCNELIRGKIAEPLVSTQALLDGLGLKSAGKGNKEGLDERVRRIYAGRLPEEKVAAIIELLHMIRKERGISIDELSETSGLGFPLCMNLCGILETDDFISIDILQRCSINPKII